MIKFLSFFARFSFFYAITNPPDVGFIQTFRDYVVVVPFRSFFLILQIGLSAIKMKKTKSRLPWLIRIFFPDLMFSQLVFLSKIFSFFLSFSSAANFFLLFLCNGEKIRYLIMTLTASRKN